MINLSTILALLADERRGCDHKHLDDALARYSADAARLDWLDENMSYNGGGNGGTYSFSTPLDAECGMLRAAIDAAITAP